MNKINISNAPAYTSPNSMTLICTEKPDDSTNLATLAFWAFASTNPGKIMFSLNKGAYSLELLAEKKEVVLAIPGVELTGALSTSAMSRVFTAMKMWMLYLAGKVTLNLRLRSRNKKGQGGCLRIAALRFEVAI